MKNSKKGFTIVELVIVIAVLAILIAVLIPTFSTLIAKANLSKDTQLCRVLNEDIAMGVQNEKLQEHATYNDVIEYLSPRFTVENLTPTSNGDIVWDQNTNTFSLIDNGKFVYAGNSKTESKYNANGVNLNLWQIVSKLPTPENQKYSMYLKQNANVQTANIVVGFDAGLNTNVQTINYDRTQVQNAQAQNAIIRTNGGALTINAPLDTVKHYGEVDSLNIIASANASYHENGKVSFAEISKGRIVLEKNSEVSHIHVNKKDENSNEFNEITISYDTNVDFNKIGLSRDDVEINDSGTLVVALQSGTEVSSAKDYVWLTKQGIYEQITISNTSAEAGSNWVDSSNNSQTTQEAAKQLANNIGRDESGSISATVTVNSDEYTVALDNNRNIVLIDENDDIAYTFTTQNGTTIVKDSEGETVEDADISSAVTTAIVESVESVADKESIATGMIYFAGGTGTEKDPWMIVDYETMQNISNYSSTFNYYKVKDGIETINCQEGGLNWVEVKLNGNFDGNNVNFINLDNYLFTCAWFDNSPESVTIENFSVSCNIRKASFAAAIVDDACADLTLKNIEVTGYIQGANAVASFVGFGSTYGTSKAQKFTFINCESTADIVSTSQEGAGFIAHPYQGTSSNNAIYIIDSKFTGSISYANKYAHYVAVNASNKSTVYMKYSEGYDVSGLFQNDSTYSLSSTPDENGYLIYGAKNTQGAYCYAKYTNSGKSSKITIKNGTLPQKGNVFSTDAAGNAVKATAIFMVGPNGNGTTVIGGNYTGAYIVEELTPSANTFTTSSIKYFDITINGESTNETGVSDNIFNIVNSSYGTTYGSSMVSIIQYNSQGGIVAITTWNLGSSK